MPAEGKTVSRPVMAQQPVQERIKNFNEVPFGFTPEQAKKEAGRCLQCKKPACVGGCPVEVKIPEFIKLIKDGNFAAACPKIKETNSLPAVCGRVCPQEDQCEKLCILGKKGQPIAIGGLERFAADFEINSKKIPVPETLPATGFRVAVVGSGPGGLTIAGDLAKLGHSVTVFEALHKPGGVLIYGIPEFRLPKSIVAAEVEYLERLGVKIEVGSVIGRVKSVDELLKEFNAVFLGLGAGLPKFMKIPGENLIGVYSANEYLTRSNLMKAYRFPEYHTPILKADRVVVVGGGNVAMDCARTARRLGSKEVHVVYRRTSGEMPARNEEFERAVEEGIIFQWLTEPVEIKGNAKGWVEKIICQKEKLGAPDASGRPSPVPIPGSEFEQQVDIVIIAIGTGANPLLLKNTPGLDLNKRGYIVADPQTGKTSVDRVYAGGDIVTGSATVIEAMGAGKKSARAIHEMLKSQKR